MKNFIKFIIDYKNLDISIFFLLGLLAIILLVFSIIYRIESYKLNKEVYHFDTTLISPHDDYYENSSMEWTDYSA